VAGLVNSFTYSYPEPPKGDAASLTLDLAECPWNAAHHLARIALRARADAAVMGTEVQVAFNVRRVSAYRLIGYEGRHSRDSDSAGDTLSAGQVVTALYEIVPTSYGADEAEWLTVKMRCREPNGRLSRSLMGQATKLTAAPADFRFAAAAAEFGLLLRESKYRGEATYGAVRIAAREALGADADGRRAEFLALVDAADQLSAARKVLRKEARAS
jgi:Ca-activated chloride channel homolog